MAEARTLREQFFENLHTAKQVPENVGSQQSIYRIPSSLRDLDPEAYEPRVVSIGPYHRGKAQLQAMEEYKYRAVNCFLGRNNGITSENILAEFEREPNFLKNVRNCYTEPLGPQWSDDEFKHLMVLDGCVLLELLQYRAENRAYSYVQMDMLVLDNQIPLLVLTKLASIIANFEFNALNSKAPQPTGSEDIAIQVEEGVIEQVEEQVIEQPNITKLIWKFNGTMNDEIPADDAHHVLDAYRKGCIGTGAYDGWASSLSVRELYYHGVKFRPSSSESFRDVEFNVSENYFRRLMDRFINRQNNQNGQEQQNRQNNESEQAQQNPQNNQNGQEQQNRQNNESEQAQQNHQNNQNGQAQSWTLSSRMIRTVWRFIRLTLNIPFVVAKGTFSLPRLTIDGTTRTTLRNLMAYERLHLYSQTHPVTNYVSLMGSLIRSENDVEHLRKESILLCSPGWTNESVVQLFADLTRNVVFNGTRTTNPKIDALCERRPNKFWSVWRRLISPESSDVKSFVVALLTFYGLVITGLSTCFTIVKYFKE